MNLFWFQTYKCFADAGLDCTGFSTGEAPLIGKKIAWMVRVQRRM
jgi:hypothetical protein